MIVAYTSIYFPKIGLRITPSTGRRAGPTSGPPRDAVATTGTSSTTSPEKTSGSGLSEGIGNAPSTARICPVGRPRTASRNAYFAARVAVLR